MIQQLNPPLPMDTVRGPGLAHFLIDYGPESHLMWVVFLDADGACWTVPNPEVRMQRNWSLQRRPAERPFAPRPQPAAPPTTSPPGPSSPPAAPAHDRIVLDGIVAGLNGHAAPLRHDAAPARGA